MSKSFCAAAFSKTISILKWPFVERETLATIGVHTAAVKFKWAAEEHGVGLSISVFGLGYVGSVSAACFAHLGHKEIGVDVSPVKVEALGAGRSPSELVAEAHPSGRLRATTNPCVAVSESDLSFVCVGTPSLRSGKLDLTYVERVIRERSCPQTKQIASRRCPAKHRTSRDNGVASNSRTGTIERIDSRTRLLGLLQPRIHAGKQRCS